MNRVLGALGLILVLSSCELGGGGGGGGTILFNKGWTFVREDDRNLYIADESDTSTVSRLTTSGGVKHPSLSADGKRIAYVFTLAGESSLYVVPTAGGDPRKVTTQPNLRTPVFSPDGSRLVFAYDEGSASVIGTVNADGSGFAKLAGSATLAYASPSFAADGKNLWVAAGNSVSSLMQLELINGTTGAPLDNISNLGAAVGGVANRVAASVDGHRLAFDGRLSGAAVRIFVVDLTTKQVTQLTDYPGDPTVTDGFPCWHGIAKVCFSSDSGGGDQVYSLDATRVKTSGGLQLTSAVEPWYGPY